MKNSPIEWTEDTDNIIVVEGGGWWCRMISPGCANCYAARLNRNTFYGGNHLPYSGQPPKLLLRRDIIDGWQRQTRPRKHFVASMTDVFGEWVEREWIFYFLDGMLAAPLQTFQVLTKRPAVAARETAAWLEARGRFDLPPNIWIGTSVEDQQRADERIPFLLMIPASVRFLSCEPLLGPVDLCRIRLNSGCCINVLETNHIGRSGAVVEWPAISWVIVGGESGPKARPMHPDWPRSLRDQCAIANTPVPFFFKQWGEWADFGNGYDVCSDRRYIVGSMKQKFVDGLAMNLVGKKAAGRLLDDHEHNQFPQLVTA